MKISKFEKNGVLEMVDLKMLKILKFLSFEIVNCVKFENYGFGKFAILKNKVNWIFWNSVNIEILKFRK